MKNGLISSLLYPAILVVAFVLVKLAEITFDTEFGQWGVFPRKISGFIGIFTFPFIHGDWKHLTNNSSAILILGTMLYYFYREMASKTFFWIYVLSGVWLWMGGRANFHIGASAVVYGLFSFLFVSGLLRKHLKLMALSLLVIFLYGSLVWGIFPVDDKISFEGHLFGLLAGVVVAIVYREQGTQRPKYSWDLVEEEEVPDWFPYPERKEILPAISEGNVEKPRPPINIKYVYKKKESES